MNNLKQASETCGKVLSAIEDHVQALIEGENVTKNERETVDRLCIIGKHTAQIGGELRKMESHEAKLTDIPHQVLLEFFRKLSAQQRAQWIRDIGEMDRRKESVLS
jgi:hypothetical protein